MDECTWILIKIMIDLQGFWQPEGDKHRYHVAIKVLNEGTASADASKELLQEGVVMATVDHENVVRLFAVCMGAELMLISQFVPLGALISYLKKHKDHLNAYTMLNFSVQIAKVLCVLLSLCVFLVLSFTVSCAHLIHSLSHTHIHREWNTWKRREWFIVI